MTIVWMAPTNGIAELTSGTVPRGIKPYPNPFTVMEKWIAQISVMKLDAVRIRKLAYKITLLNSDLF